VSIPAPLAAAVRRVAKERQLTLSRAIVTLVEPGVRAERDAKASLNKAYRDFLAAKEPSKKKQSRQKPDPAASGLEPSKIASPCDPFSV